MRDCSLVVPRGNFSRSIVQRSVLDAIKTGRRCDIDWSGNCKLDGAASSVDGKAGSHWWKRLAVSEPLPQDCKVDCIEVEVEGMDQGWGNSGDSGVLLSVLRGPSGDSVEDTVTSVDFDRNKSKSTTHRLVIRDFTGLAAPQPGDRLSLTLRSPQWGGWTAYCASANVQVLIRREEEVPESGELQEAWMSSAQESLFTVWHRIRNDKLLQIDKSHLSIGRQRSQSVFAERREPSSGVDLSLAQLMARHEVPAACSLKAKPLFDKLDGNVMTVGAPADEAARRRWYDALRATVVATWEALQLKPELMEAVCTTYGESAAHCVFRWDRDVANMHDLVTGDRVGEDAMDAEGMVLRSLHEFRKQLAEHELHRAKAAAKNVDVHFESYFYSSLHFGLEEQEAALRDPNRLNYREMNLMSPECVQRSLMRAYSPGSIRAWLRKEILESTAEGAQARREKLLDWLRAHIPLGYQDQAAPSDRMGSWVFDQCHDEGYRMTDAALNFLLCRMRILDASGVVRPGLLPERREPLREAKPAPERHAATQADLEEKPESGWGLDSMGGCRLS